MEKVAETFNSNCILETRKAENPGIGMMPVEVAVKSDLRKMKTGVCV